MLNKILAKMAALNSELAYRIKLWQYALNLLALEAGDRLIIGSTKLQSGISSVIFANNYHKSTNYSCHAKHD
ncbi:hypothetical protein IQ259_08045 [Fortiea sp. LEGE XX443]|uniref:hypothetical protein n=1 Tax=Fortiea sp. LEGE XX443 TaxID=1828611 RepID=UPI00187E8B5B|nr:hypothetical protein [Fortiea sp. LEGE XX443]MBE9004988.1 hypothetical protein [Fortiea sp. LEGE XX443]